MVGSDHEGIAFQVFYNHIQPFATHDCLWVERVKQAPGMFATLSSVSLTACPKLFAIVFTTWGASAGMLIRLDG
jgi:hypothetical protein